MSGGLVGGKSFWRALLGDLGHHVASPRPRFLSVKLEKETDFCVKSCDDECYIKARNHHQLLLG